MSEKIIKKAAAGAATETGNHANPGAYRPPPAVIDARKKLKGWNPRNTDIYLANMFSQNPPRDSGTYAGALDNPASTKVR